MWMGKVENLVLQNLAVDFLALLLQVLYALDELIVVVLQRSSLAGHLKGSPFLSLSSVPRAPPVASFQRSYCRPSDAEQLPLDVAWLRVCKKF